MPSSVGEGGGEYSCMDTTVSRPCALRFFPSELGNGVYPMNTGGCFLLKPDVVHCRSTISLVIQ
jgi:hypothetical protein